MSSNYPKMKQISECFIKSPKQETNRTENPYYLGPNDLALISGNYIQNGLLYTKPSSFHIATFLENLKGSLSHTMTHFYPLSGRLSTLINEETHSSLIFVDCNEGDGVRFIHSTLDVTKNDILSPIYVTPIVYQLFDHDRAINHDGHTRPLLSIQVTELIDGIFIGCSMNHAICDETSFWHFLKTWSQLHTSNLPLSNPPIHNRWLPKGSDGPQVTIPFTHPGEFLRRYEAPQLQERFFHFSSDSILKLKMQANAEVDKTKGTISSFQALSALVWRAITQARSLAPDQNTTCNLAANIRHRLDPPLPEEYFGNLVLVATAYSTVNELLEKGVGWSARLMNRAVAELTDMRIRGMYDAWIQSPCVYDIDSFFDSNSVVINNSPRFDVYGIDLGLGKPVTVRSGYADKHPGSIIAYSGSERGGSVDLAICLTPECMKALESDEEFMASVTQE